MIGKMTSRAEFGPRSIVWWSSVASPKNLGGAKRVGGGKMFDFRRITLFCLGYRLSNHKMTICSENLERHGPLAPLGYAYGSVTPGTEHWT